MQPKFRKNLLFWTFLAYSGANWCCITQVDATLAANSDTPERNNAIVSIISSMAVKEETHQPCHKNTNLKAMSDDKPNGRGGDARSPLASPLGRRLANASLSQSTGSGATALSRADSHASGVLLTATPSPLRVYAAEKENIKYFQLSTTSETANFNHGLELGNASGYNWSSYGVGSSVCNSLLYSQQPPPKDTPPPNPPPPNPPNPPNPPPREEPRNIPSTSVQRNEPPQLEGQPNDFPQTSPTPIEQLLEKPPLTNSERLDRLIRRLQEGKETLPPSDSSAEIEIRARPIPDYDSSAEIEIRARPIQLPPTVEQPPLPAQPVAKFKPIGSLRGYVGFFATNNIFSSEVDPIQDGLVFSGLTLASAPLALGPKTYLSAGIDGNLIFYIDQSQFNYNQVRFYLSIYQQLSRRMYGELGWSNQQLFYAKDGDFFSAGDRFLNENSVRLSLGRRDPLTQRLVLDSFYELRFNFADPDSRNRINNSLLLSLSYYWLRSLQVGLDYQFNLSDFTLRQREDQYHRLYTHLTYGISDSTNVSLQGGVSLGGSTDQNINFDGWFFTLNYNWELGKF
ncbi:MAG: hypothetical protein KME31_07870 [Tolypothrix carrinoi HA7290-LM1]|nr:hypothetical protein [Tolypothrix carrinoi HA7290-LM1]